MEQIIDGVEKEVEELTNAINDFGVLLEDPANTKIKSSRDISEVELKLVKARIKINDCLKVVTAAAVKNLEAAYDNKRSC